jgi:peptidoglycan/LPS O-acetylase OafA/YrhL
VGTLRILLALSVVAGHSSGILGSTLVDRGVAVHLFFVVSGFYMALILTRKYRDHRTFYINRVLRLWPTYLVVLVAACAWFYADWLYTGKRPPPLWIPQAFAAMPFWQAFLLHASNITMVGSDIPYFFSYLPGSGFLFKPTNVPLPADAYEAHAFLDIGQAWSISLEIWFYLAAPFLVGRRILFLGGVVAASMLLNLCTDSVDIPTYFFFPSQLYLFVVGILLYRFYERYRTDLHRSPLGPLALVAVTAACLAYERLPASVAPYFIFAICVPAIPWLFAYFCDSRWDTELGNLSYPIYLTHPLIAGLLLTVFHVHSGTIVAVMSIAASAGLYWLVERPVDRFRQALVHRRARKIGRETEPVASGSSAS